MEKIFNLFDGIAYRSDLKEMGALTPPSFFYGSGIRNRSICTRSLLGTMPTTQIIVFC
jgi:hypothetical protein